MKAIDVVLGLLALPWVLLGLAGALAFFVLRVAAWAAICGFFLLGPWILLYFWLTGQFQ